MRSLVLLLVILGLAVGLVPAVIHVVEQIFLVSDVEYNGVYEPLRGVEMSRAYETSVDLSFEARAGLELRRWMVVLPSVGAGMGGIVALLLHSRGFRLSRDK